MISFAVSKRFSYLLTSADQGKSFLTEKSYFHCLPPHNVPYPSGTSWLDPDCVTTHSYMLSPKLSQPVLQNPPLQREPIGLCYLLPTCEDGDPTTQT